MDGIIIYINSVSLGICESFRNKTINYKIADNFFNGISIGMSGTITSFSTWINSLGQQMILNVKNIIII